MKCFVLKGVSDWPLLLGALHGELLHHPCSGPPQEATEESGKSEKFVKKCCLDDTF